MKLDYRDRQKLIQWARKIGLKKFGTFPDLESKAEDEKPTEIFYAYVEGKDVCPIIWLEDVETTINCSWISTLQQKGKIGSLPAAVKEIVENYASQWFHA